MKQGRITVVATLVALISLVTACDFGPDDETRLQRAEQSYSRQEYRAAAIELKNILRSDPANVMARVLLGKVSLEAGDPATAAKELQRARELGADYADYAVPMAYALLGVGQLDEVLAFDPVDLDSPDLRVDLNAVVGNAYLRKGDIAEARRRFELALDEQPGHADALIGMARIHVGEGNRKAAEDVLKRVISLDPAAHAAYAVLARLQLDDGEYALAEASFRKAIENAQSPALVRERLLYMAGVIDALLARGDAGAAQDLATQMLDLAPDNPFILFQASRADFEAGELDKAIEKAQRVVSAFPDYQPARLLLAAAAMSKENFALAEVHLRTLVIADPDNAQARSLLAQAQMSLGSPEEAFAALEPLIKAGASDPRLLALAGSAGLRSGKTAEGVEYLTRGVEAGGADPELQMQAASSFLAAGEIDKAIKVLESMPESMHGNQRDFLIVLARLNSGDTEGARAYATQLLADHPDDAVSYQIMGGFHMAVKEQDAARVAFGKALELDPTDVGVIVNLARLDSMAGDNDAAMRRYRDLLRREPGNLVALLSLSQLTEKAGKRDDALALLETAREKNPDAVQPLLLLSRYYLRTNRMQLALQRAEQAVDVAPNNAEALNMLGSVELETDRYSEALGTFEQALQHGPKNVEARFNLARAQLKLGMGDAARRSLETSVQLDPKHLGARVTLTRMDSLEGNFPAALALTEQLKRDYPDRPEPLALEGDIHIMRGHFNDAIAAYDRAGELFPNEIVTIKRYEARKQGGRADAQDVLEEWLRQDPGNARVRLTLAQACQDRGDTDRAVAEYRRVLEQDPGSVVAMNNLAWIYSELGGAGNLRQGVDYAKRAHEQQPDLGPITDTYGWLLLKQGKVDEAAKKLRLAAKQAPEDPEIRYHLAVALNRSGASAEARDLLDAILSDGAGFSSRDEASALRDAL